MVEGYTAGGFYPVDVVEKLPHNDTHVSHATSPTKQKSDPSYFFSMLEQAMAPSYNELEQSTDATDYPNVSATDAEKIEETSQQMESLILYQLLKQMWSTIPEGTLFTAGPAEKMYREMWLEQLSGNAVKQGSVLGIADMVERQLLDQANRTVEISEIFPELTDIEQDMQTDSIHNANPYGYLSGLTPGF